MKFPSLCSSLLGFRLAVCFLLLGGFQNSQFGTLPGSSLCFARGHPLVVYSAKEQARTNDYARKLGQLSKSATRLTPLLKVLIGVVGFVVFILFAIAACLGICCCLQPIEESTTSIAENADSTDIVAPHDL